MLFQKISQVLLSFLRNTALLEQSSPWIIYFFSHWEHKIYINNYLIINWIWCLFSNLLTLKIGDILLFTFRVLLSVQKSLECLFQSVSILCKIFFHLSISRGGVHFHFTHPNWNKKGNSGCCWTLLFLWISITFKYRYEVNNFLILEQ